MSIFSKKETAVEEVISPTVIKYKLVSMQVKTDSFRIFEDEISEQIKFGWKPQGGIDVKSISVSGWLLTQAMIKE